MTTALPLAITLHTGRPAAQEGPSALRVAHALLDDGLLSIDALEPGWDRAPTAGLAGDVLLAMPAYDGLVLGAVTTRLRRSATREHLAQQVRLLPAWTITHFADDLERAVDDALATGSSDGIHVSRIELPPIGDQCFGLRLAQRGTHGGVLATDVVVLRRGALVMSLSYWHDDGTMPHAGSTAYLALKADRIWSGTAETLRRTS